MKISDDVLEVLSAAVIDGAGVRIGDPRDPAKKLDRSLYERTDKVLNAAGAKWHKGKRMHVFEGDISGQKVLDQAIVMGEITTAQDIDYFPTPDAVIDVMFAAADLRPTHEILEPSAGRGAIAKRIQAAGARRLVCVEQDEENWRRLRMELAADRGLMPPADFLDLTCADIGSFDRIIMNPPFSNQADIRHIRHAYGFLKPGGRAVSIASPALMYRQDRRAREFREWLEGLDHDIHRLPEGSFKSSGTGVSTIMVTIERS